MFYTNEGIFKPMFILLSIIMLPLSICLWALTCMDFRVGLFIVSMVFLFGYFAAVLGIYKFSKSKKEHLSLENDALLVKFGDENVLRVETKNIVKLEYYKISSLKSWFLLFNYVSPQCVYITYKSAEECIRVFVGYLKYSSVVKLCDSAKITLVIK